MICRATGETIAKLTGVSEAEIRVAALAEAYGTDAAFLRFFADTAGNTLAVLDGNGVFAPQTLTPVIAAEWTLFLAAQPEIRTLRSSGEAGKRLVKAAGYRYDSGAAMVPQPNWQPLPDDLPTPVTFCAPEPEQLYGVIAVAFGTEAPAFEGWYVDVSHRMRHGVCRGVCALWNGVPAACAMTVAEGAGGAVIGGVATVEERRRQGLGGACVTRLTAQLTAMGKRVWIAPCGAAPQRLYASLGFTKTDTWTQGQR